MATQIHVPGPIRIWVGTGSEGALEKLGWSEGDVRFAPGGRYEDVHTDISGPALPMDVQYFGQEGHISFTLVDFDWVVFAKLKRRSPDANAAGLIAAGDIGRLMKLEGGTIRCLLELTYSTKTAYPDLPAAFNAPHCIVADTIEVPLSTRASRPRVVLRALPNFSEDGSAIVWNNDVTGLPGGDG